MWSQEDQMTHPLHLKVLSLRLVNIRIAQHVSSYYDVITIVHACSNFYTITKHLLKIKMQICSSAAG